MENKEFYSECARLLNSDHEFVDNIPVRRGRWGPRYPGNGRFPGFGTIRIYSDILIHMSLNRPETIVKTFDSKEKVLEFLRELTGNE